MSEMKIEALTENLPEVLAFVDRALEDRGCPAKAQMQIDLAVEELFVNIAQYAYHPQVGSATVKVAILEQPLSVVITLIDQGRPYDPLAADEPDITLSAEDRQVGGLGIYMVKKSMDEIGYEYKDGQNILTIKKKLK